LLASELDFEHEKRDGGGAKKALHTTTISGRTEPDDPRSLVVFYRSHLGGFGNLLETLLRRRDPKHGALTVQSDLSTVNLVTDKELLRLFVIRVVGCTSHARRPFALYQHEDPTSCGHMLELFKGLFLYEQGLNLVGRNYENVLAVRHVDSRELWRQIKELAEQMSTRWSRETKLGEGARYIVRNFDKLTAYLDDPRLDITNNFSERMLRMEKLIEASSLFRTSIEGRCALDVLRTVLQTAIAAGAPLQTYLLSVLRASPDEIQADPERFTPRAWVAAMLPTTSLDHDMTRGTETTSAYPP
jgi:predicted DNA binding CopG/RHH family protein